MMGDDESTDGELAVSDPRNQILDTIRNLRAKASDAASTEAEAMAAASIAAKLLQKHDVKETELEIKKDGAKHGATDQAKVLPEVLNYCAVAIEKMTETECYQVGAQINYIGIPSDVEMALYLSEMLVGASKRAWYTVGSELYGLSFAQMTKARLSFYQGFGVALHNRLMQMATERAEARTAARGNSTGTALVMAKGSIIKTKMAEMGLELVEGEKRKIGAVDPSAYKAGSEMGHKVNLNRPVDGDANNQGALT